MSTSTGLPTIKDIVATPEFAGEERMEGFQVRKVIRSGKHALISLCDSSMHSEDDGTQEDTETIRVALI